MALNIEDTVGEMLSLAFAGTEPSAGILATLRSQHVGGISLYRTQNLASPAQVRTLTAALQACYRQSAQLPLIITADHEGGTMLPVNGLTPFPGHLALGAARSPELARRVGYAMGRELAAMGINVDFAPDCDLLTNPQNPAIGPRSFGDDPILAASLSAAMVEGLQAAGVGATAKHFPGHGATEGDSHHGTPVSRRDKQGLRETELPPFIGALEAGAKLVMTTHVAFPAWNDDAALPATLSSTLLCGLLRGEMGFKGVIITDAMDMKAIAQGPELAIDALAAVAAGVDLLLLTTWTDQQGVYAALKQAVRRRLISAEGVTASAQRVLALKEWLAAQAQPPLEVVGCAEHAQLAAEVAARSITLVRDNAQLLPLRLSPHARVAAVMPQPADLTPADTSSYIAPGLAAALRACHPGVDEFVVSMDPPDLEIAALRERLAGYDLIVVGTISALTHPGQAALANMILDLGIPAVIVSLRLPHDLRAFPSASTYVCTYSILEPSMQALAQCLWGQIPFSGQLPVSI